MNPIVVHQVMLSESSANSTDMGEISQTKMNLRPFLTIWDFILKRFMSDLSILGFGLWARSGYLDQNN